MAEPTTPTIDAMVDLLPATGTESAVLGTFPDPTFEGIRLAVAALPANSSRPRATPQSSGGSFSPSSPSEDVGVDVIERDDVVCPMKVDTDEAGSVEAQACAIAVAERRAPRAVVGMRQATF